MLLLVNKPPSITNCKPDAEFSDSVTGSSFVIHPLPRRAKDTKAEKKMAKPLILGRFLLVWR